MLSKKLSNKPKLKVLLPVSDRSLSFEAIGTSWRISIDESFNETSFLKVRHEIAKRIDTFDRNYSRFRADSLVTRMANEPGTYRLPDDAESLLSLYGQLYDHTVGAMTPLIGQVLSDAGYDANYSLKPTKLHETPKWDVALALDFPNLVIKQPVLLDFGAVGKGYLVDIIGRLLSSAGLTSFSINAGGDILQRHASNQPDSVGLEHPDNPAQVIGVAHLLNQSLCGSAGNRRSWGEFHHIIDPRTNTSPRHLRAVWVSADSTMLADGLTTALFFCDAATLRQWYDFEYALIRDDYSLEHSNSFPAEFFTEEQESH